MTLSDPRPALAEHCSVVGYLMGIVAVSRLIDALAEDGRRNPPVPAADDFVHLLLGLASIGTAIEQLVDIDPVAGDLPSAESGRWLR